MFVDVEVIIEHWVFFFSFWLRIILQLCFRLPVFYTTGTFLSSTRAEALFVFRE